MTRDFALIVGGASGIGLATAEVLAAEGYELALFDQNAEALAAARSRLGQGGWRARTYPGDVSDASALIAAVADLEQAGRLRILVNAAGILHLGTINEISEQDWDQLVQVNLKGVFLACKAVIPVMARLGGGAIVNLASQSGRTKSYYSAPDYVASKAGVIGLTMVLANQHARDGIRVNCVAPGVVETPMVAAAYTAEQQRRMIDTIPLGRFARPEELASVIAFLASERSSYVTGQTINVNGGSFMQ
ncbi:SDR family NAD(P)-dependent oxidoreductase [Phenylobacterium sp. LjRoot219]|uniref:SDR family NAD(P)-dependent oxidoreductase n=1 Tax=Phenylobacterium sp. LjRoot219 TaxID=3342283 RepID=UPI003ECECA39